LTQFKQLGVVPHARINNIGVLCVLTDEHAEAAEALADLICQDLYRLALANEQAFWDLLGRLKYFEIG